MKLQTLIYAPNNDLLKRLDDFLYQPSDIIIINDVEYYQWNEYDSFEDGLLVRKICLKQ